MIQFVKNIDIKALFFLLMDSIT